MDISSNNQLVPYHQGPRQVTPYAPERSAADPADGYRRPWRYVPKPPPHYPGTKIHPGYQASIYTSKCQTKAQESDRVGLLVNIYA